MPTADRSRRLALGLALSAWFWLPALAERDLVQIGETIEPELFASFFLRGWPPFRLEPLFDYQRPVSMALGSPIFWPQLGLVQVAVTIVGAAAAVRTSGLARAVAIWAILLALGGYADAASAAGAVCTTSFRCWRSSSFRGVCSALVGLGSAILAGVLVEALSGRAAIRGVFATAIVGASLVTAVAPLDPEIVPVDERLLSVETIARIELAEYGLGSTHSGEYLPVSSGQRNAARFRKTLIEAGGGAAARRRPDRATSRSSELDWRPDRIYVEVSAAAPERLILHQFAFPGWSAWVDGVPVQRRDGRSARARRSTCRPASTRSRSRGPGRRLRTVAAVISVAGARPPGAARRVWTWRRRRAGRTSRHRDSRRRRRAADPVLVSTSGCAQPRW